MSLGLEPPKETWGLGSDGSDVVSPGEWAAVISSTVAGTGHLPLLGVKGEGPRGCGQRPEPRLWS